LKNKKNLLVGATVLSFGITSIAGMSIASAASNTDTGNNNLVDKIAAKFNLNKSDVQKVFDEDNTARQAERQKNISDDLQNKVDKGEITAAQKTLIENKLKEMQTARDSERKDLETWATNNKIDAKYVMFHGMRDGSDNRLQAAVDDKKITAEQKTLIENKQKELQTKHETERDALKKWATDNKLDLSDIMPLGGGPGRGPGGPGRF
jgi:cellobiose-specific phosphotransferase system component IIA